MVSATLLESRIDTVRTHVMSNFDLCFSKQSIDRKVLMQVPDGEDTIQTVYLEKDEKSDEEEEKDIKTYKVLKRFGELADKPATESRVIRPSNGKHGKQYEFGLATAEQLTNLDRSMLTFLSKVNRVVTQD